MGNKKSFNTYVLIIFFSNLLNPTLGLSGGSHSRNAGNQNSIQNQFATAEALAKKIKSKYMESINQLQNISDLIQKSAGGQENVDANKIERSILKNNKLTQEIKDLTRQMHARIEHTPKQDKMNQILKKIKNLAESHDQLHAAVMLESMNSFNSDQVMQQPFGSPIVLQSQQNVSFYQLLAGSSDEECELCFENPKNAVTKCGHEYCHSCLDNWCQVQEKTHCPLCMADLKTGLQPISAKAISDQRSGNPAAPIATSQEAPASSASSALAASH